MSRYRGPRVKKMRALGVHLPGLSRKTIERRPQPPGQHGHSRRGKLSDYARQLREKQKLRLNYGLRERQMRRLIKDARRSKLATGDKLVELLERRLDNVVFRSGFAPTIPAARQLVNHGHILVDGRRTDIASYRVAPGQIISLRTKSANLTIVEEALKDDGPFRPDWLSFDRQKRAVTMTELPTLHSLPLDVDLQLVVEFYSKLV